MKEYRYKINGNEYAVTIDSIQDGKANVTVNGISYEVEMEKSPAVPAAPIVQEAQVQPAPAPVQTAPAVQPAPAAPAASAAPAGGKAISSPLPGVIIEVCVKEGDTVKAGQQVAVLEAMKMENAIEAEYAGTVKTIHVHKGDSVLEGAPIITIA